MLPPLNINYDPLTGQFTWAKSLKSYPKAGKPAGYVSSKGVRLLRVNNKDYRLDKLAFYLMTGEYPERPVYPLNGDPADLRFSNLAVALPKQPMSQDYLRSIVRYEEEAKGLILIAHSEDTVYSQAKLGERIGRVMTHGYRLLELNKARYLEHRLVWLYHHGYLPTLDIDHINRDRADNRLCNLREVSRSTNLRNASRSKANKSGHTGVYQAKTGMWCASIRKKHLGSFADKESAIKARERAEKLQGFSPLHGKVDIDAC